MRALPHHAPRNPETRVMGMRMSLGGGSACPSPSACSVSAARVDDDEEAAVAPPRTPHHAGSEEPSLARLLAAPPSS